MSSREAATGSNRKRYRAIEIECSDASVHEQKLPRISTIFDSDSDSDGESLLVTSVFREDDPEKLRGNFAASRKTTSGKASGNAHLSGSENKLVDEPSAVILEVTNSSSKEWNIREIQNVLPVSREGASSALRATGGDVERAVAFILDTGMLEDNAHVESRGFTAAGRHGNHETIDLT